MTTNLEIDPGFDLSAVFTSDHKYSSMNVDFISRLKK